MFILALALFHGEIESREKDPAASSVFIAGAAI